MSRPPPELEKVSLYKNYKKSTTLPPISHLPLRKRLTMEGLKSIKKQGEQLSKQVSLGDYYPLTPGSHASSITVKSDEEVVTDQENVDSKAATFNKIQATKLYKTVVIQQKMTKGKMPCNPLLWNSEDVEKNAPWIAVEESIESFKSAWLEGNSDDNEEEERPTKKTAKRGRPPSNTKQPIEVDQPDLPKRKNSQSSSKKTNPLDDKLYCICRKPYDSTRFMIACDVCDDWFHGECISIKEIESEFVDLYYCHKCSKVAGKYTSWKPKCSNPACNKAARISSHLGNLSKYCSSICGIQVARARIQLLEIKRRNTIRAHLPSIPELVIDKLKHSKINSLADKEDRERLVQIQQERNDIRCSVNILKKKSKLVELSVKQTPLTEEEMSCGFDSRLIWADDIWKEIEQDPNINPQIQFDSKEPFSVCQRLKCTKHRQWQMIMLNGIKQEKTEHFEQLLCLEEERDQIKSNMKKRRCHTDLIKEYLINSNISI